MRYRDEIVQLPERPQATTLVPGRDRDPDPGAATAVCRSCRAALEASWRFCPSCSTATAPPSRDPGRGELLDLAMREQRAAHEARFAPPPATGEQLLLGALMSGGQPALAAVGDLTGKHFSDPGRGYAFKAMRSLERTGRYLNADLIALEAGLMAEAAALPGPPRQGRIVAPVPSASDLVRWAREVRTADAIDLAVDLAAEVMTAAAARAAEDQEQQDRWATWEEQARQRAPEGRGPCPACGSWIMVVGEGWLGREYRRQLATCSRCANQWDAMPREQLGGAG